MPEGTVDRLRSRLQALHPHRLTIADESASHAGHEGAKGGGGHFRLHLVSDRFEGLPRLARHRLVYDSLGQMMQREVHALAMVLQTPDEAGVTSLPPSGK
jgi:BolA family transcriptional regulator, general stress-responsive regulator